MSGPAPAAAAGYVRRLGWFSGTMAVVGGMIGSGIFLNPAIVAQRVGTASLTLAVWLLGGLIAVLGGLIYAELGGRLPQAGGSYAYLRAAFGPLAGFLYAWGNLLVIGTGAAAAVGYTFASYTAALFHLGPTTIVPLAVLAIVGFSALNLFGVHFGAWTQNVLVILKLGAIGLVIAAGLLGPAPDFVAVACTACAIDASGHPIAAVASALVPVLFAYGGWQQTNYVAEEIVAPERNLPRALVAGVGIVVVAYLLANVAYLRVLGVNGLASSLAPAVETAGRAWGELGRRLVAIGVVISTAGFLNTICLLHPRLYQAMARDGLFLTAFANLHPKWRTPVAAIGFQAVWAILLLATGSYGALLNYVVFADWLFFGATAVALLVIRRRATSPTPGFRAPAAGVIVPVFVAAAAFVVIGSIASSSSQAARGAILLGLGVPVYWLWTRKAARAA